VSNPSVNYRSCRIIPGPLVTISQETIRSQDTSKLSVLYTLTLTGTIVADRGSPNSSGGLWTTSGYPPDESIAEDSRLAAIERKIESIKNLFSVDYGSLEFQSADGSAPLKANVRVKSLNFDQGPWHDICAYTIVCEADSISGLTADGVNLITAASESWDISDGDVNRTYRVTHTMSATARSGSGGFDGWQNAKNYVQSTLLFGLDTSVLTASALAGVGLSSANVYNYTLQESENQVDGTYQAVETWTLTALNNVVDTYNVTVRKISDDANSTTVATIAGSIKGFYVSLGDFDTRYTKALTYWNGLASTLLSRCNLVANISLDAHPISAEVDYNPFDGTINYNYAYSDKNYNTNTIDTFVISKEQSLDDYKTTVGIDGVIEGRRFDNDTTYIQKFNRALAVWSTIKSPSAMLARITASTLVSEIADLRTNPIADNVQYDQANGKITYSFKFDNRANDNDTNNEDVREVYTVSKAYSREDGISTYTVNGTVEGLRTVEQSSRAAKYAAALSYYTSVVNAASVLARITAKYSDAVITDTRPIATEEEKNSTLGTITYTYRYNTFPAPYMATALSEKISVSESNHDGNINIVAEIAVPGRVAGPIFQDMNTTPKKTLSLEIEAVFAPLGGTDLAGNYGARPDYSAVVISLKPTASKVFLDNDVFSWDWRSGRYSRSVQWSYQ
jgi:hypothetical protein